MLCVSHGLVHSCDSPMAEIELKNALAVGKENEIVAFAQP